MHALGATAAPIEDVLLPYRDVDRTPRRGGCWVMANMVAGLDGSAAFSGRVSELSSARDSELFTRMRGLADVVLVGAETVRRERYGPVRLPDDLQLMRRAQGRSAPRIAIVSRSLDLDPELPVFSLADSDRRPLILTSADVPGRELLDPLAEIVVAGRQRVDLVAAMSALAERSMSVVLCEGGPTLLGELIAADLLDEYCLTLAPLVGGDPLPVVKTPGLSRLKRFRLAHVIEEDSTLFLRYTFEPDQSGGRDR